MKSSASREQLYGPAGSKLPSHAAINATGSAGTATDESLKDAPFIRRIAILGNVSVGKSTLFDSLCPHGEHSVLIPGSTFQVKRGILSLGEGGASRRFHRHCAGCSLGAKHKRRSMGRCYGAEVGSGAFEKCPACAGRGSAIRWRSRSLPLLTHLFDVPGTATLAANGEDGMIARDLMLSGQIDAVIFVADAKNLRRSLAFAVEIAELGLPMVLALNMIDEAESMGIDVDEKVLERELEIPVQRLVAVEGRGTRELTEIISEAKIPKKSVHFPPVLAANLARLEALIQNPVVSASALGLLLMSGDERAAAWVKRHLGNKAVSEVKSVVQETTDAFSLPLKSLISDAFFHEAEHLIHIAVTPGDRSPSLLVRFGYLAQRPLSGILIALVVLVLAYLWVGTLGATLVVDNLAHYVFEGFLIPMSERAVSYIPWGFAREAIMDADFGILPTGLFLALGLVLPVLFFFYLLQAVLEDSGYLPRLAVLLDRVFRGIGLNGQSLIPLVLGFSCVTMAIITTRMLPTKKERIVLTLLLMMGIPCAPLLAVMMVILQDMSWTASAVVFGVIGLQIVVAGFVASKIIPGGHPDLILEIPKMRIPRIKVLLTKTWRRTWQFMKEAIPVFIAASFVVFLFNRWGGLQILEDALRPLMQSILGLPDVAVQVFIKTVIRRESGATELNFLKQSFDNVQLVVAMLVMTFLMPCINAMIVLVKERGLKVSAILLSIVMVWAITVGSLVNSICRMMDVTFL